MTSDLELLSSYTRNKAEEPFAELVRRHLNLVYSAALRQVRSPQLAEEVAQSTFTDLARNAHRLAPDTVLTAWLYQVTRHTAIDVVRREARRQLREQIATELTAMNATAADWTHIEPLLDEAMHALDDTDRTAVLLRYFENKSLREVGQALGVSDDTAQKRVSRAVDRLREFFTKRGVTIGAGSLIIILSANAVQAAPIALFTKVSAAAALTGAITKTIATHTTMNWITAKTVSSILAAAIAAGAGTYFVQKNETNRLRIENQNLVAAQQKLTSERDAAVSASSTFNDELERARKERNELVRLRSEVGSLHKQTNEIATLREQYRQLQTAKPAIAQNQEVFLAEAALARHNACINNLRAIDGAMQQYALENKLTATDTVTREQILPYLPSVLRYPFPVCPSGGTYTFSRVDTTPACSVPGHTLP